MSSPGTGRPRNTALGCLGIVVAVALLGFVVSLSGSHDGKQQDQKQQTDSTASDQSNPPTPDKIEKAKAEIAAAMRDPQKVKLMECMGIKVYEDPQPPGHPPSAQECAQIEQQNNLPPLNPDGSVATQPSSKDNSAAALPASPSPAPSTSNSDIMTTRFGNTVISQSGGAEWHLYFRPDGTFDGRETRSNYSVGGTWKLEGTYLCLTYEPPVASVVGPQCKPITAHQVGDTWAANGVEYTLADGIR